MKSFTLATVTVAVIAASLAAGCASALKEPVSGFLCCNQTLGKGWVSSENIQGGLGLPFGTPVKITSIKRERYAYGVVGATEYGFSQDSAKSEAETAEWLRTIVVAENPKKIFDTWPDKVRAAVGANKVFVGMTREQVLMSIGHPSRSITASVDAPIWKYWTAIEDDPVELQFDAAGVLAKVSGKPASLRMVEALQ